jgi:hypothetical protein
MPLGEADVGATAGDSFDVEAVIEAFVADLSQVSLKLPHMTTGQRKQARKIADQRPELICESFGFGAERQLHLFKEAGASLRAAKPIDGEDVAEAATPDGPGAAPAEEEPMLGEQHPVPSVCKDLTVSLSGHSTNASGCSSGPESAAGSVAESPSAEPGQTFVPVEGAGAVDERVVQSTSRKEQALLYVPPPAMCQVRNTFIHVEGVGPVDERLVRSMPHGMFSQCMAEAAAPAPLVPQRAAPDAGAFSAAAACFTPAGGIANQCAPRSEAPMVVPADSPVVFETTRASEQALLSPGTEVVIEGLLKSPAFNGLSGTVQSFDEGSGRYSILLNLEAGSGHQWAKVKGENLQLRVPPPPYYPPALELQDCPPPKDFIFGEFEELPGFPPSPMWGQPAWTISSSNWTALV